MQLWDVRDIAGMEKWFYVTDKVFLELRIHIAFFKEQIDTRILLDELQH